MKINKMIVTTIAATVALILLIAWGFYQALQLDAGAEIEITKEIPQKAVMAQVQAMNEARLNELAQNGQVTRGMNENQVRVALGEPARIEETASRGKSETIWWYEHEGWMSVVFNEGEVSRIDKQP